MDNFCILYTTTDTHVNAHNLAKLAVQHKLAACVNIKEVHAIYDWQNQICENKEFALYFKTNKKLYPELETFIQEQHSYECPLICMLPVEKVNQGYELWLDEKLGESAAL
jgi:periplasmic divalent cation tolerance protein